jgi:hypothetical protein
VVYDDIARRPNAVGRKAGPGCGNNALTRKPTSTKPASMQSQVIDMLNRKCAKLEAALAASEQLGKETTERCEQLAAIASSGAFPRPFITDKSRGSGRAPTNLFSSTVGVGYAEKDLSHTTFNHVNSVMATIRKLVGDDAVKALQLSDRIQQRARGQVGTCNANDRKYFGMCIGVFNSIKSFLQELSSQYNTKAPNDVRRVMQTVVTALMSNFDKTSHCYLASHLELDHSWLPAGKARALTFYEEGLIDSIAESREARHNHRIPDIWKRFAHGHWLANCRAGEKMRDKLRNPKDRSDKELYTIHYRENTIVELHEDCLKEGLNKWPVLGITPDDFLVFPDDEWEDLRARSGFQMSQRIYRDCKPFQIKIASRDQCLCIWHLRFEYLVEGLYNFWKERREAAKTKCDCPHLKTGTALRHHCNCPRANGVTTDKITCVRQQCRNCKDLKRLNPCDKCLVAFGVSEQSEHTIKYQIYGKREYTKKKGRAAVDPDFTLFESRQTGNVGTKPDFVLVESHYDEFIDYLSGYWPIYIAHHDLSKHQDADWERQRQWFPRGTFVSTQDYSENYHHEAKKEYQSAYFVEIGSTVYGMAIRVHLADIGTEADLAARGLAPVISDVHRAC